MSAYPGLGAYPSIKIGLKGGGIYVLLILPCILICHLIVGFCVVLGHSLAKAAGTLPDISAVGNPWGLGGGLGKYAVYLYT